MNLKGRTLKGLEPSSNWFELELVTDLGLLAKQSTGLYIKARWVNLRVTRLLARVGHINRIGIPILAAIAFLRDLTARNGPSYPARGVPPCTCANLRGAASMVLRRSVQSISARKEKDRCNRD